MLSKMDTNLVAAPLYHIAGLSAGATPTIYSGGKLVLLRFFDPEKVIDLIDEYKVTTMFGIPTMFWMISQSERFDEADFSSLRFLIVGSAPCSVPLIERYLDRGAAFDQGYGLTETASGTWRAESRSDSGRDLSPVRCIGSRPVMTRLGHACFTFPSRLWY